MKQRIKNVLRFAYAIAVIGLADIVSNGYIDKLPMEFVKEWHQIHEPKGNKTALLIIDYQTKALEKVSESKKKKLADNLQEIVEYSVKNNIKIYFTVNNNLGNISNYKNVLESAKKGNLDSITNKNYMDAFMSTTLYDDLMKDSIGTIVMAGGNKFSCFTSTFENAIYKGFNATTNPNLIYNYVSEPLSFDVDSYNNIVKPNIKSMSEIKKVLKK